MADETNSTNQAPITGDSTTTPETPPAGTTERRFTQSEVEGIVKERLARQRPVAAATPKAPEVTAETLSLKSLAADNAELRLRIAFEKRAAKLGVPDEDSEDIFENYRNKPADARDAWLEQKAKRFMPTTTPPVTATTTAAATVTETKPVAAPNTPGRVNPLTAGGLVDVFALNDSELAQLGPQGLRTHFENLLTAGNRANGAPQRPTVPKR